MQKQLLMLLRFNDPDDVSNISFKDVLCQVEDKGNKFFKYNNENVILTEPHTIAEGATYIITSEGLYRTLFGGLVKRQSILDIEGLIRNVKSESRKSKKHKPYSVRKLNTIGKTIKKDGYFYACFNLDFDKLKTYEKIPNFFEIIAKYLKGDASDFLGVIDNTIEIEPVKFGVENRGYESVILNNQQVGIVRLNNGTYYTCDEVPLLKSQPRILEPTNGRSTENWKEIEDRGIQLFLDANRYELKAKN